MLLSVGIDVGKSRIDCAGWHEKSAVRVGSFSNSAKGFAKLARKIEKCLKQNAAFAGVRITLEACGGYEEHLIAFALDRDWIVGRPNPRQVRDYAKAMGYRSKTDGLDAIVLARFGQEHETPAFQPPAQEISQLQSLLRRRKDLKDQVRRESNRADTLAHRLNIDPAVGASLQRSLAFLKAELASIDESIKALIRSHDPLQAQSELLMTLPGVGPTIAPHLVVLLHNWELMTDGKGSAKELTAFVGLDPRLFQSGDSVFRHPRISKMGDAHLRSLLYFSALAGATRTLPDGPLRVFYERLVRNGKSKKTALTAAARKVLVWSLAIYRSQQPFDPERHLKSLQTH